MVFYEIRFHTQPNILFACSVHPNVTANSRNIIDHREDILELTVAENTDLILECDYDEKQETVIGKNRMNRRTAVSK